MKVIIVGGGIGGLAAALSLHAVGITSVVFEQSSQIRELGVGINTLPHAIEVLAQLGLLPALDAAGVRTGELIYMNRQGSRIWQEARGLAAGFAVPQFSIHRGKLQGVFRQAVLERLGPAAICTGHQLVDFEQDSSGVRARFKAGSSAGLTTVGGDLLLGCDGIHSRVRAAFYPQEGPPSWNGIMLWRGATWWPPFLSGRSMIIAGGMGAKLVLYPILTDPERPGEVLMNWAVTSRQGEAGPPPHREDWSRPGRLADLLPLVQDRFTLAELDPVALIKATPEFYEYPMCDREPLARWSHGRVTLLGDAAHPMYPVGSNGASQAVLDAQCLAQSLAAELGDPAGALVRYEAQRLAKTTEIVLSNRAGGPERVIDLVESRAPDGFKDIHAVASQDELTAIVRGYAQKAGFAGPGNVSKPSHAPT